MDLLEINKRHVSAYHWPSPGLILNKAVRVLHNYCKRALVLGSHRLRVWLDIAYPTSMKSWYYPDAIYHHRWCAVGGVVPR